MIGLDNDDCPSSSSGSYPQINSSVPPKVSPATNTQSTIKPPMATESDEGALSDSTTSSSSSDSSDSDSDAGNAPAITGTNGILVII